MTCYESGQKILEEDFNYAGCSEGRCYGGKEKNRIEVIGNCIVRRVSGDNK